MNWITALHGFNLCRQMSSLSKDFTAEAFFSVELTDLVLRGKVKVFHDFSLGGCLAMKKGPRNVV